VTARTILKMALAKGRLLEPSLALLRNIGAAVAEPATNRKLLVPSSDGSLSVLFVKPADVPVYVESGAADVGITGTDVLRETEADVLEPLALGFGRCRMVVASPTAVPYPALTGGVTPRVATKYPRLTRAFFAETGLGVQVIGVSGSVEVARCSDCRTGSWTWSTPVAPCVTMASSSARRSWTSAPYWW